MNQSWKDKLPINHIQEVNPVAGGDVNDAYQIKSREGMYFLLVQKNQKASFYDAEAAGLKDFEDAGVTAPKVINQGQVEGDAYLLLTFLQEGTSGSQKELGALVAKMHKVHQSDGKYGYHLSSDFKDVQFDNYWKTSWSDFFIEGRMDILKDTAVERSLWNKSDIEIYDSVRKVIKDTLSSHQSEPSLLHGDLWGGNYMFLTDGRPALFDPAPLYGDREFDLGATRVFGGFTSEFYETYNSIYPLKAGAGKRIQFYEFYLLLLHLVKFGSMYKASVERAMHNILTR